MELGWHGQGLCYHLLDAYRLAFVVTKFFVVTNRACYLFTRLGSSRWYVGFVSDVRSRFEKERRN